MERRGGGRFPLLGSDAVRLAGRGRRGGLSSCGASGASTCSAAGASGGAGRGPGRAAAASAGCGTCATATDRVAAAPLAPEIIHVEDRQGAQAFRR